MIPVFHPINSESVKKILENYYFMDFSDNNMKNSVNDRNYDSLHSFEETKKESVLSKEEKKAKLECVNTTSNLIDSNCRDGKCNKKIIVNGKIVPLNEKFTKYPELMLLLQKAKDICFEALKENKNFSLLSDVIGNFIYEETLMYVMIDAFLHLDKKYFLEHNDSVTKKYTCHHYKKNEYSHLFHFFNKINENENNFNNFNKNFNKAKVLPWADEILFFGHTNSSKKRFSTYLDKWAGLLVYSLKKNPYYKFENQNQKLEFVDLTASKIRTFFVNNTLMLNGKYKTFNFTCENKIEKILSLYWNDSLFDYANIEYMSDKLRAMHNSKDPHYMKQVTEIAYQTFLIPDIFAKKRYIDKLFNLYLNANHDDNVEIGEIIESRYARQIFSKEQIINTENLRNARAAISFLAKIYFPLLSACFYVLLFDKYKDILKVYDVLFNFVEQEIGTYYEEREKTKLEKIATDAEAEKVAKDKISDMYLVQLFSLIRENIFTDEKTYKDVKRALSIRWNLTQDVLWALNNLYLQIKVADDPNNRKDFIPYEHCD